MLFNELKHYYNNLFFNSSKSTIYRIEKTIYKNLSIYLSFPVYRKDVYFFTIKGSVLKSFKSKSYNHMIFFYCVITNNKISYVFHAQAPSLKIKYSKKK